MKKPSFGKNSASSLVGQDLDLAIQAERAVGNNVVQPNYALETLRHAED